MASSSSSSSSSFPQKPSPPPSGEFLALHCRMLYSRLISSFPLDPAVFITLMGLWVYYERISGEKQLIFQLCSLPPNILSVYIDESILVLQCASSIEFTHAFTVNNTIPITQKLTKTFVTLGHVFNCRREILNGVQRVVEEVCWTTLGDLYSQVVRDRAFAAAASQAALNSLSGQHSSNAMPVLPQAQTTQNVLQNQGQLPGGSLQRVQFTQNQTHAASTNNVPESSVNSVLDVFSRLNVNIANELHADPNSAFLAERTMVLIFQPGQPISKWELTDFFNRTFGNCVLAIQLQQVTQSNQEPLRVRVILDSPSLVEEILGRDGNAVFNINGKRAWGHKLGSNIVIPAASSSGEPSSPTSALVAGVITRVLD